MTDFWGGLAFSLTLYAVGVMVFFGAAVAPTAFQAVPLDHGAKFLRALFPKYHLMLAVATGLAALAAIPANLLVALALALVCTGFVYARQSLTPRINALRDRELAGDAQAKATFERAHRLSVLINGVQALTLLLLAFVLGWTVI